MKTFRYVKWKGVRRAFSGGGRFGVSWGGGASRVWGTPQNETETSGGGRFDRSYRPRRTILGGGRFGISHRRTLSRIVSQAAMWTRSLSPSLAILKQTSGQMPAVFYGVVSKRLLTFLCSLYKEVTKTTSGTLVYRFERQTARKKFFLRKTQCPRLRM